MSEINLLIVDDEADVVTFLHRLLDNKWLSVTGALNIADAKKTLRQTSFGVALVDLKLPDGDGLSLLKQIKSIQPDCEVIIMTGYSTTRTAVKAMQLGAYDYLEKPFENIDEVESLIRKAALSGKTSSQEQPGKAEWTPIAEALGFQAGTNPAMRRLVDVSYKIAKKNINILIQGETGTGKEVLARFIHSSSNRSSQIFTPVNCGALPENLLESELFGHEKGAFTGASNIRRGIFEMTNHGTLFLDEIGEAGLPIQVKLLRILETGEFLRVGGEKTIKTDVRIIAATNVDLEKAIRAKTFREDLFYRLNVVNLELPSLRERKEDIPLLAEHFIRKANPNMVITPQSMQLLLDYHWPGNIRELANTINHAIALCDGMIILPEHLNPRIIPGKKSGPENGGGDADRKNKAVCGTDKEELLNKNTCLEHCFSSPEILSGISDEKLPALLKLAQQFEKKIVDVMKEKGMAPPPPGSIEEVEARAIYEALIYYNGNISRAARSLGIGRNTFYRKMKEYAIKKEV